MSSERADTRPGAARDDGFCPSADAGRIGPGTLVLVVGPSGAGKDTLISYARDRLADRPDVVFCRRLVTRTADADLEDHDSCSPEAFEAQAERGAFPLFWRAHGLGYALPATLDADITAGRVVVANVSRGIVDAARRRYAAVVVAEVRVPRALLAERLAARGRETRADIAARLDRDVPVEGAVVIDNAGPVEIAGETLLALILSGARAG